MPLLPDEPTEAILLAIASFGYQETHGGPVRWEDLEPHWREYRILDAQALYERILATATIATSVPREEG